MSSININSNNPLSHKRKIEDDSSEQVRKKNRIYDSDDELSDDEGQKKIAIFKKTKWISATQMTLSSFDPETGLRRNIKGGELISFVHKAVDDLSNQSPASNVNEKGIVQIQKMEDWMDSLGRWKGMSPSEEMQSRQAKFKGGQIKDGPIFPIENHRVYMPSSSSTGRLDLTYPQIIERISSMKKDYQLDDATIAKIQLWKAQPAKGKAPDAWDNLPVQAKEELTPFFDFLNILMLGIEPSGLKAGLLISLMTLDLIAKREITYTEAFKAHDEGGVYPYANFGNNKGTFKAREAVLINPSMKKFRQHHWLSPTAVKEAVLIKRWLISCAGIQQKDVPYQKQARKIQAAIKQRWILAVIGT